MTKTGFRACRDTVTEAGLRPASVTGAPHFVWGGGARARVPPPPLCAPLLTGHQMIACSFKLTMFWTQDRVLMEFRKIHDSSRD